MIMQERFYRILRETGCIPIGSRLLVALSGGADSVALLSLLRGCSRELELQIEAAHLDHSLRSTSCDDADFVVRLCLDLEIPLTSSRCDVAAAAREKRGNLEEVARDLRRSFLLETAKARNCELIVLGHHADDQAETFVMRLLRGAGPGGLAGMRLADGMLVRPLLSFRKQEILDYLSMQGLGWREDGSNQDLGYTRNSIRHRLLPELESYNPQIVPQLSGLCERLRQDEVFLYSLVQQELARCLQRVEDEWQVDCASLTELPPALAGRVVRAVLQEVRGDLRGLNAKHVAAVIGLVTGGPVQGEIMLPEVWVARRYEICRFRKLPPELPEPGVLTLSCAGDYSLPDGRILRVTLEKRSQGSSAQTAEFCADSVNLPLLVRSVQPGDRLRPSGMVGTKKLQDLFVDLKLTREERQSTPLIARGEEVLWVVGLRRCAGYQPEAGRPVLRLTILP